MRLVKLSRPDGADFFVAPEQVVMIEPVDESPPNLAQPQSYVWFSFAKSVVQGRPETVARKLGWEEWCDE